MLNSIYQRVFLEILQIIISEQQKEKKLNYFIFRIMV